MSPAETSAAVRVGVGTSNNGLSMSHRQGAESVGGSAFHPETLSSSSASSSFSPPKDSLQHSHPPQNPWGLPAKDWREMDARSAPFQSGNRGATSPTASFGIASSSSSPPKAGLGEGYTPALAAPRAVPPYPRFTSPQPHDSVARSPSPTKPFTFGSVAGDARERWASLGQAQQTFSSQQQFTQQQQMPSEAQRKMMPSGAFPSENFLGYGDIWGNGQRGGGGGAAALADRQGEQTAGSNQSHRSYTMSSSHPPDLEQLNTRFDPSNMQFGREEGPYSSGGGVANGNRLVDEGQRLAFQNMTGIPASGSLSPRSLLHYHQQQIQAQQAMAMQAAQQGGGGGGGSGPGNSQSSQSGVISSGAPLTEEITTVFIVGFPDDMTEREFANMFLFAKGFEASTLKIPSGSLGSGPAQRLGEGSGGAMAGPGGPYNAVNMPGSGMFEIPNNGPAGGWDEHSLSLALSRAGTGDGYSSLGGMTGAMQNMAGSNNSAASNVANSASGAQGTGPGGKIKQIIGFAKFRTRSEALEARDALNGRKIDAERGCVLKTEMAKKNLHTKQRPVLSSNAAEGSGFSAPPAAPLPGGGFVGSMPPPPNAAGGSGGQTGNAVDRDTAFGPRSQAMGPQAPPFSHHQQGHSSFEPFPLPGGAPPGLGQSNGLTSPGVEQPYGRGVDFFPRSRLGQEGPPGTEPVRGPNGEGPNSNNNKWAPLGPLDYYEGVQQRAQQQQQGQQQPLGSSQQQQQPPGVSQGSFVSGGNVPRGPDWSALGSPTAFQPASRGVNEAQHASGPKSPTGEQVIQQQPQQFPPLQSSQQSQQKQQRGNGDTKQEDFGKGESTVRGAVPSLNNNNNNNNNAPQSPPLPGSEKNEVASSHSAATRPQSRVSTQSRQDSRTTSPVNVTTSTFVQRFGSLRIDSPNLNQPRAFSPNPRSPSGESMSNFSPPFKASSSNNTNPTSPASPYLDASNTLPSPTSRSFSIDANPPGNTLFVGNLPGSITSPPASTQLEEALRKIFSQKKGFRQMSFRVKSSGPMCFVEFEDVGCAGRALGEANGDTLDGTVKGGLRLSFSKNPLFKSTLPEGAPMQLPAADQLDLDQLSSLEETAFKQGFVDGEAHGSLHGIFEGRQLGTLKGFEVWQEIGYMQGLANFWLRAMMTGTSTKSRKQSKQIQQLEALLKLIDTVPRNNGEEVDLFGLMEKLRARYKLICSSLGVNTIEEEINDGTTSTSDSSRLVKINGRSVDPDKLNF